MVREIEEFTELLSVAADPHLFGGMQARFAFALANAQIPDILLVDEGIGAGDAQFQKRRESVCSSSSVGLDLYCLLRIRPLCAARCNKALVLSKGAAVFFGDVEEGFVYAGYLPPGELRTPLRYAFQTIERGAHISRSIQTSPPRCSGARS